MEGALPRLEECDLEKVSRLYKAKTGLGCDGFHPKVLWTCQKKREEKSWSSWKRWSEKWPQQACTTLFFLIPKNVTNERPIALVPTLMRRWEALRAPEVARWQQKYRVDWNATDGRNGGGQQTVWEMLMEMERFNGKADDEDQGAVALVLELAKAFERVSLPVVWAWATHFSFPKKILRVLCGYFEHQRRVQFEGCVAEPLRAITALLPRSKWSCLLLRIVLQDALSEVTKIYPQLKSRVSMDDIPAFSIGKNKVVAKTGKEGGEESKRRG